MEASSRPSRLERYAGNKTWWHYLLPLAFAIYLFVSVLGFELGGDDNHMLLNAMYLVQFGIHELAHVMTSGLPDIVTATAGSVTEILFTLLLALIAIKTRFYFTSIFCWLWVMQAMSSAGQYMADARSRSLELISVGGGDAVHDWYFAFGKLGWLESDVRIGGMVRNLGIIIGGLAIFFGVYLIIKIATTKHQDEAEKPAAKPKHSPTGELYPTASRGQLAADSEPEKSIQIGKDT